MSVQSHQPSTRTVRRLAEPAEGCSGRPGDELAARDDSRESQPCVALYLALGWASVMYLPDLLRASVAMMVLVAVGGLLYTGGAIVYGMKRPNPWPGHFGFHEIFHVCTVLAFLCHWTACLIIALEPVVPSLGAAG